jgi:hypothetical protein
MSICVRKLRFELWTELGVEIWTRGADGEIVGPMSMGSDMSGKGHQGQGPHGMEGSGLQD